ncbi:hypothetical protein FNH04_01310 [Streptomyces phyllanthi]|uniref:Uncharacterized protein n=1 Tax=Streptomyces phyllanthi TaxID=1803180 RepID=A0A5N8VTS4_9ACTN|nr:hypothetical protein [Streptomyces phyllanthi]
MTRIWVPFRGTSLYVDLPGGPDRVPEQRALLAGAVAYGEITRDARYGEPMWRLDAGNLHAVVEALWSTEQPVRIHLDQAPESPARAPDARRMT